MSIILKHRVALKRDGHLIDSSTRGMLKIRNDEPLANGTTTYFASQIEGDHPPLGYKVRLRFVAVRTPRKLRYG